MSNQYQQFDELRELLIGLVDDGETRLDDEALSRRMETLLADPAARRNYLQFIMVDAALRLEHTAPPATAPLDLHPSLSTTHYLQPTTFVGGPVFSYMVATVVLCLMLLGAWVYKINHNSDDMAANSQRSTTSGPSELVFVGKISGLKDCRWANEGESTIVGASVPMDREYALTSGLMEITYRSGAKVILEGPCTYKVDSDAGGYLAIGKLTARVEKKGSEFRVQGSKHSPLSTLHSPLFAVRTPTAKITDLGTEFGVEVAENGDTVSYVFQGSIKVQGLSASADSGAVLRKNESIRVSRVRETHHDSTKTALVRFTHPTETPKFARQIPRSEVNAFDLVDVVAGGNGFSGKRGRGINFNTARIVDSLKFGGQRADGPTDDGKFHLIKDIPFVDGIVTPRVGDTHVPVDSAGHDFSDFVISEVRGGDHIWAGGELNNPRYPTVVCGVDYASLPHGYLFLCANIAITFDLEAIRHANPGRKLLNFRAVAANVGDPKKIVQRPFTADIWVLVDGQARFQQRQEHSEWKYKGEQRVSIPIGDTDRFLTLAATDGGDGISHDWIIFGDPRLEMAPIDQDADHGKLDANEKSGK